MFVSNEHKMKRKTIITTGTIIMFILAVMLSNTACEKETATDSNVNKTELPDISGYPIVGTKQSIFYNNLIEITAPLQGEAFYGQNAHYPGNDPKYIDNGDGTITDLVTGLMWSKSPDMDENGDIDASDKMTYSTALAGASAFNLAGYNDWRLPSIKELYSLIMFNGEDVSPESPTGRNPFINTDYFDFAYGDTDAGERIIDAQYATTTKYVDFTMGNIETMFGVNFADGRIKGYGLKMPFGPEEKTFYVMYVRGNTQYGVNDLSDNATGLMWMQNDSGEGMNWKDALSYAENFEYAAYSDWRLPDVKELQSIVDYTRSPETTNSAALDPMFNCTEITNEAGEVDYPFYWTGTTHANGSVVPGGYACYVSFGRAMGYMNQWIDVHGAGAQRSDPKAGDASEYPTGHGPQGDAVRIDNYVRLVRQINN